MAPADDRRARMLKYTLAMSIRMVCIVLLLFVQGWWLFVVAVGAIALPYLAVVLANVGARPAGHVERPGGVVAVRAQPVPTQAMPARDTGGTDPRSSSGSAA